MFNLALKPQVRRYDLSYLDGDIRIHMHPRVAQEVRLQMASFRSQLGHAEDGLGEEDGIGEFVISSDRLGFGGALVESEEDGETVWSCMLPDLRASQMAGMRISASWWVALDRLMFVEAPAGETRLQLMAVDIFARPNAALHGFPISAKLSAAFVDWLGRDSTSSFTLPEIEGVLRDAWSHLWPEWEDSDFRAFIQPHARLILGCPGSATGLGPERMAEHRASDEGYELTCHNVDSPLQQLTLFAGLARLNEHARRPPGS